MYSTCLFCHADLGRNDALEDFPVGRRLAFDAANGRLWVVCRRCERWNLTPLEERWAAIDACERLYRDTRTRVSSDEIGLARLREGTELVRIGRPLRPEFAAWRYGDQFGRRYRRYVAYAGGGLTLYGAAALASHVLPAMGVVGVGVTLVQLGYAANSVHDTHRRVFARVALRDGRIAAMTRSHLIRSQLSPVRATGGWALTLRFRGAGPRFREEEDVVTLRDEEARRAAAAMLPGLNFAGATRASVRDAVALLDEHAAGDAHRLFASAARMKRHTRGAGGGLPNRIGGLSEPVRLALEMASHEEQERRAMDGELALLEAAWKDAEALARIADAL